MEGTLIDDVRVLLLECSNTGHNFDSLNELLRLTTKGLIRDIDFTSDDFCDSFRTFIVNFWTIAPLVNADTENEINKDSKDAQVENEYAEKFNEFVGAVISFPEFDQVAENKVCTSELAVAGFRRAELAQKTRELNLICTIEMKCYINGDEKVRGALRRFLGSYLKRGVASTNTNGARELSVAVSVALRLAGCIIKGFQKPLSKANITLLNDLVLPLHSIPGKVTYQKPALALIHKPLVFCVTCFVEKQNVLLLDVLSGVLKAWPSSWAGNSPKEVLLIHEIESLLEMEEAQILLEPESKAVRDILLGRLSATLASDHSVVCERTLILWKNEDVFKLLCEFSEELIPKIMRSVLTRALVHWNTTVVNMTVGVLTKYLEDPKYADMLIVNANKVWNELEESSSSTLQETRERLNKIIQTHLTTNATADEDVQLDRDGNVRTRKQAYVPEKQADAGLMNMVFGHELGTGSFGKVFYTLKVNKNKPRSKWKEYAVKQIPKEHGQIAHREASMMDLVSHPNCTRLIALYETRSDINLVLEYAAKGDLHTILSKLGSLDMDSTRFIAAEVAAGIGAVHAANLIFGDLKPENVLIHGNGHAKLGDFGATRFLSQVGQGAPMEGTLIYFAPELAKGNAGTRAVDWWAFGCLIYQMISGRPPLWITDEQKLSERLVSFKIERFPSGFPENVADVVLALLEKDPKTRLGSGNDDYKEIEKALFFREKGFTFDTMHTLEAPVFSTGTVRSAEGPWTQRTYSMLYTPLPSKYSFDSSDFVAKTIPENNGERLMSWLPNSDLGGSIHSPYPVPSTKSISDSVLLGKSLPKMHNRTVLEKISEQEGGPIEIQVAGELPPAQSQKVSSVARATASYLLAKGGGAHLLENQGLRPIRPSHSKYQTSMPHTQNATAQIMKRPSQGKVKAKRSSFGAVPMPTSRGRNWNSGSVGGKEQQEAEQRKKKYHVKGLDLTAG